MMPDEQRHRSIRDEARAATAGKGPSIALQEGLFERGADDRYHLLGSRCEACNMTFFPQRKYCGKCGVEGLARVKLSDRGTVFTFSLIDRKSRYSLIEPPYVQAEVLMPEGIRVYTVLDQCTEADVSFGMPVEMYVGKVHVDAEGRDVVTYKFRPALSGE